MKNIIKDIDLVCLMSVNPGFGGQSFIESTYEKIRELRGIIDQANADTQIEIDGGVTDQNANILMESGANVLVAGSFVFSSKNPQQTILGLKNTF